MTERQENAGCGNFEKTVGEVVKTVSSRLDCVQGTEDTVFSKAGMGCQSICRGLPGSEEIVRVCGYGGKVLIKLLTVTGTGRLPVMALLVT